MLPATQVEENAGGAAMAARPDMVARWPAPPGVFDKLRSTALTGLTELFARTLADVLSLAPDQGRALVSGQGRHELPIALRALDLSPEQAFLLAACVFGSDFAHPEAIRLFVERFSAHSPLAARATVREWRLNAMGMVVDTDSEAEPEASWESDIPAPANEDRAAQDRLLKVS
jgi:uncharacterized protein (DUF2336 family)